MFDALSVRKMIEGHPVVIGDHEHDLRLVGVTVLAEGGAQLAIRISGTDRLLRLNLSAETLTDLEALRRRVVHYVERIVTGETAENSPES